MKIKKMAMFTAVTLLMSPLITGGIPTVANAESSSNSSSVSVNNSSSTEDKKNNPDLSTQNNDTATVNVQSNNHYPDNQDNEFIAQPDNVDQKVESEPDFDQATSNGFWFLIPILHGFRSQPQSEQNIVKGDIPSIRGRLVTDWNFLFPATVNITIKQWSLNNGVWELATKTSNIDRLIGLADFDEQKLAISKLDTPGTYYYQLSYTDGASKNPWVSQKVKVNVLPDPVPATGLSISAPPVVFTGDQYNGVDTFSYDALGPVTPSNSTDPVNWIGSGNVRYTQSVGRQTKFSIDKSIVSGSTINTDVNKSGIPVVLNAKAGAANGSQTVYVGGVPARTTEKDVSVKWPVDGISDFVKTTNNQVNNWDYSWSFFDSKNNKITNTNGVNNISGSVTDLNSLNSGNQLTINKGQFMDAAYNASRAGAPYYAQLTINYSINGNKQTITSNKANLYVTEPQKSLTLDSVPNFDFGTLKSKDIYNGFTDVTNKNADNHLIVTAKNIPSWNLTASMNKFTTSDSKQVDGATLMMKGISTKNPVVDDKNLAQNIVNSTDSASGGNWSVEGHLAMAPNPTASLGDNNNFSSNIIWTLTGPQP